MNIKHVTYPAVDISPGKKERRHRVFSTLEIGRAKTVPDDKRHITAAQELHAREIYNEVYNEMVKRIEQMMWCVKQHADDKAAIGDEVHRMREWLDEHRREYADCDSSDL